jgi:uncharacterized protein YodC (DUF2158 family)
MPAFSKHILSAIAVALGIALSVPLSIPAFSDSAPANTVMRSGAIPPLRAGDLVRVRSGGPLMTVTGVHGDQVNCSWTNWDTGQLKSESFPTALLAEPFRSEPPR